MPNFMGKWSRGFTLLEVLLALTLSMLVMAVLIFGMNIVVKDWQRTSNHLDASLDIALVLLQIERAFEGAFPHTYWDRDENKLYIFFEGEEEQVKWVSTVSPNRQPGLTAWQLTPSKEKEGGLEIRVTPAYASDPTENLEDIKPITVLTGYSVHFEYLYVEEQMKDDSRWEKKWSAEKLRGLPHAVRMVLKSESDQHENDLEMIALLAAHEHDSIRPVEP